MKCVVCDVIIISNNFAQNVSLWTWPKPGCIASRLKIISVANFEFLNKRIEIDITN